MCGLVGVVIVETSATIVESVALVADPAGFSGPGRSDSVRLGRPGTVRTIRHRSWDRVGQAGQS